MGKTTSIAAWPQHRHSHGYSPSSQRVELLNQLRRQCPSDSGRVNAASVGHDWQHSGHHSELLCSIHSVERARILHCHVGASLELPHIDIDRVSRDKRDGVMSELKRVVRNKSGRIIGVEPGDPHAPDAQAWRSATKELSDAQAALQKVLVDSGVTLPQAAETDGLAAVEAVADHWHVVDDPQRYSLIKVLKDSAANTKRSTKQLADALRKAAAVPTEDDQSS
jgi:hypothetical protein